jgi:two-component system, OmpR family, phosphate regulon response regulator PhoB
MSATFVISHEIGVKFQEGNLKRGQGKVSAWLFGDYRVQRCIVIADDDPTVIDLLRLRLSMAQYHVIAARDAVVALEMVRTKDPVAVILDVQMPGGGGLSALLKIKSDPRTSSLPVMILTGERNAETVLQAMDGGADDYMVKPFHPDALLERVSRLVSKAGKTAATWEI